MSSLSALSDYGQASFLPRRSVDRERPALNDFSGFVTKLRKTAQSIQNISANSLIPLQNNQNQRTVDPYQINVDQWVRSLANPACCPMTPVFHKVFQENIWLAQKVFEGFGFSWQLSFHFHALTSAISVIPVIAQTGYSPPILSSFGNVVLSFTLIETAGRRQHFFSQIAHEVRNHLNMMQRRYDLCAESLIEGFLKANANSFNPDSADSARKIRERIGEISDMIDEFSLQRLAGYMATRRLKDAVDWILDAHEEMQKTPEHFLTSKQPCRDARLRAVIRERAAPYVEQKYAPQAEPSDTLNSLNRNAAASGVTFPQETLWHGKRMAVSSFLPDPSQHRISYNLGVRILAVLTIEEDTVPFSLTHMRILKQAHRATRIYETYLRAVVFLPILTFFALGGAVASVLGPLATDDWAITGWVLLSYLSAIAGAYYSRFSTGINPTFAALLENDALKIALYTRDLCDEAAAALIEMSFGMDDAFSAQDKLIIGMDEVSSPNEPRIKNLLGNPQPSERRKKVQALAEAIQLKIAPFKKSLEVLTDNDGIHVEMTILLEAALDYLSNPTAPVNEPELRRIIHSCKIREAQCLRARLYTPISVEASPTTNSSSSSDKALPSTPEESFTATSASDPIAPPKAGWFKEHFKRFMIRQYLKGTVWGASSSADLLPDTRNFLTRNPLKSAITGELVDPRKFFLEYLENYEAHIPVSEETLYVGSMANACNRITYLFLSLWPPLGFVALGGTLLMPLAVSGSIASMIALDTLIGVIAGTEGMFYTGKNSAAANYRINKQFVEANTYQRIFDRAADYFQTQSEKSRATAQEAIQINAKCSKISIGLGRFEAALFKFFGHPLAVAEIDNRLKKVIREINPPQIFSGSRVGGRMEDRSSRMEDRSSRPHSGTLRRRGATSREEGEEGSPRHSLAGGPSSHPSFSDKKSDRPSLANPSSPRTSTTSSSAEVATNLYQRALKALPPPPNVRTPERKGGSIQRQHSQQVLSTTKEERSGRTTAPAGVGAIKGIASMSSMEGIDDSARDFRSSRPNPTSMRSMGSIDDSARGFSPMRPVPTAGLLSMRVFPDDSGGGSQDLSEELMADASEKGEIPS